MKPKNKVYNSVSDDMLLGDLIDILSKNGDRDSLIQFTINDNYHCDAQVVITPKGAVKIILLSRLTHQHNDN